jgi:hypothetical protein
MWHMHQGLSRIQTFLTQSQHKGETFKRQDLTFTLIENNLKQTSSFASMGFSSLPKVTLLGSMLEFKLL